MKYMEWDGRQYVYVHQDALVKRIASVLGVDLTDYESVHNTVIPIMNFMEEGKTKVYRNDLKYRDLYDFNLYFQHLEEGKGIEEGLTEIHAIERFLRSTSEYLDKEVALFSDKEYNEFVEMAKLKYYENYSLYKGFTITVRDVLERIVKEKKQFIEIKKQASNVSLLEEYAYLREDKEYIYSLVEENKNKDVKSALKSIYDSCLVDRHIMAYIDVLKKIINLYASQIIPMNYWYQAVTKPHF